MIAIVKELLDLNRQHVDISEPIVEELDQTAQFGWDLIGDENQSHFPSFEIRLDLLPKDLDICLSLPGKQRSYLVVDVPLSLERRLRCRLAQRLNCPMRQAICCIIKHLGDDFAASTGVRRPLAFNKGRDGILIEIEVIQAPSIELAHRIGYCHLARNQQPAARRFRSDLVAWQKIGIVLEVLLKHIFSLVGSFVHWNQRFRLLTDQEDFAAWHHSPSSSIKYQDPEQPCPDSQKRRQEGAGFSRAEECRAAFGLHLPLICTTIRYVKLIAQLKLQPTSEQADALKRTLEASNAACNSISYVAWETRTFGKFALQKLCYQEVRETFGLSAQMVVRALAKVGDAYKLDKQTRRTFRPLASIAYDDRILSFALPDSSISIWTLNGRQAIPFVCGERQRTMLQTRQGESDLLLHRGDWYLLVTCEVKEPALQDVDDVIGVDLGVTNIASDSDGTIHSSRMVNTVRYRHWRLRAKLQRRGTKAARRRLKQLAGQERRFAKDVNHTMSKRIVETAERTKRAISREDLKGIRTRVRYRLDCQALLGVMCASPSAASNGRPLASTP